MGRCGRNLKGEEIYYEVSDTNPIIRFIMLHKIAGTIILENFNACCLLVNNNRFVEDF